MELPVYSKESQLDHLAGILKWVFLVSATITSFVVVQTEALTISANHVVGVVAPLACRVAHDKELVFRKHGFAVKFPRQPEVIDTTDAVAPGKVEGTLYSVDQDEKSFIVAFTKFAQRSSNPQKELEIARDRAAQTQNAQVIIDQAIRFGGFHGRDFKLSGELTTRCRIISADERTYQILYIAAPDQYDQAEADRFIESFRLLNAPSPTDPVVLLKGYGAKIGRTIIGTEFGELLNELSAPGADFELRMDAYMQKTFVNTLEEANETIAEAELTIDLEDLTGDYEKLALLSAIERPFALYCGGVTDARVFEALETCNVKELYFVGWANIGKTAEIGVEELAHVVRCSSIQSLDFSYTKVTPDGLALLSNFPSLRRLTAPDNVTANELELISQIPSLEFLKIVSFADSAEVGLRHLAQLERLKDLWLLDEGIDPKFLASLKDVPQLQSLFLKGYDQHVQVIAKVNNFQYLQIDLPLSASSVSYLKELSEVETLSIRGPFTRSRVGPLLEMPNLKRLAISDSLITAEQISELVSLAPDKALEITPFRPRSEEDFEICVRLAELGLIIDRSIFRDLKYDVDLREGYWTGTAEALSELHRLGPMRLAIVKTLSEDEADELVKISPASTIFNYSRQSDQVIATMRTRFPDFK